MSREIVRALREGSTRPTMALLALASLFVWIQLLMLDPLLARPRRVALGYIVHPDVWAYAHLLAVLLTAWRLWDRVTRPGRAWLCNGYMCALWSATYLAPVLLLGDTALLASALAVFPLAAMWVLMRTEATPRDRAQA